MPKKISGENSKAVAAKAKKSSAKEAESVKKQKQLEDAYWKDDHKQTLKKEERKTERDKKKQTVLDKKAEARQLLEREIESIIKVANAKSAPPPKMTRAQIAADRNRSLPVKTDQRTTIVLEQNLNRSTIGGDYARNVTEAISILSDKPEDKPPEKRRKAAYMAYERRRLLELQTENPTMRLSQMKKFIFKDWQKSPENPSKQILNRDMR